MIKVGDYIKHKGNEVIYKVVSRSEKLLYVTDFKQTWQHIGVDVATNNYIVVDYKQLYEQQKQKINSLKTEILIINNDVVNSGDKAQMEITGRVIEALENTIVDDWRVGE